jgi:hypothetical protein
MKKGINFVKESLRFTKRRAKKARRLEVGTFPFWPPCLLDHSDYLSCRKCYFLTLKCCFVCYNLMLVFLCFYNWIIIHQVSITINGGRRKPPLMEVSLYCSPPKIAIFCRSGTNTMPFHFNTVCT